MKILMLLFITGWLPAPGQTAVEKWVIEQNSSISIEGKSNVNCFSCDVPTYLRPDTVTIYKDDHGLPSFTITGGPVIPIYRFDCHQRFMTADLRKTLKADEGSVLKISLLNIGPFTPRAGGQNIKGWVTIELAGVTQKMELCYVVQAGAQGMLHLCGSRKVLFSDFGLTPPTRLAGLVRVDDAINVSFRLILRPVPGACLP